jgi:hypothetical protein
MRLLLLSLFLLTTLSSGHDDDIDAYDYGSGSSHYVAPALKELVTEVPRCLPPEVVAQMSGWLQRMNALTQYRLLYAVGVQRLIREMEAGQSLCAALPLALHRMYGKQRLSLRQRQALDEADDDWAATLDQMTRSMPVAESQCRANEARAGAQNETRWADAHTTLMCLKGAEKEAKKRVSVYYFP